MSDETAVDDSSPEVKALRQELNLVTGIFYVLGEASFKAAQAERAAELMAYANGLVVKAQDALNSRIATEELGKPMKMSGDVLSLAKPAEASH